MIFAAVLLGALLHCGAGLAAEPGEVEPPDMAFRDGQIILTPGEINIALRFELFQKLLREGAISDEEFQDRRRPNLGALLPFTHEPASVGLDGPVPSLEEVLTSFRELRRAVERGVAKVEEAADMRAKIFSAILPRVPRERASRPPRPQTVMDSLTLTSHLAGFRGRGVITEAEFEEERRRIDELAHTSTIASAGRSEASLAPAPKVAARAATKEQPAAPKVPVNSTAKEHPPAPKAAPMKTKSAPPSPKRDAVAAKPALAPQLPVPRFVSLRGADVKMRAGPGDEYPVDWLYRRDLLPVEVIEHSMDWRRIRDPDGDEGWVSQSVLTSRRMGMIRNGTQAMKADADDQAKTVVALEQGVIVEIRRCPAKFDFCRVSAAGAQGWVRRDAIWGVYPEEVIE